MKSFEIDDNSELNLDEMLKNLENSCIEERIYEKLEEIKIELNSIKAQLVKDLTINELKILIKEIIAEELPKYILSNPIPTMPISPIYYQQTYPWDDRRVYCDIKSTPYKSATNTTDTMTTYKNEIKG